MKALIQHLLTCYAHLVVRFLETQLVKRLLIRIYTRKIEVNGIKHLVICNTALYYIRHVAVLYSMPLRNQAICYHMYQTQYANNSANRNQNHRYSSMHSLLYAKNADHISRPAHAKTSCKSHVRNQDVT